MTPDKLSHLLTDLINKIEEEYGTGLTEVQRKAFGKIISALKSIEVNANDVILQNANNRKVINKLQSSIDSILDDSGYVSLTQKQIGALSTIVELNTEYFSGINGFKSSRKFLSALQNSAIAEVNTYILNDGLVANFKTPLLSILNQSINTGAKFSDMVSQVSDFVKGDPSRLGALERHAKTYLVTTLMNYSRSYQKAVAEDLELKWFFYSGGVVKDSRPFCVARASKFFITNEVQSWAELEWAGKIADTTSSSIFVYCGGWNCRHSLIPVSDVIVPEEDMKNAKDNGYL